MDQRQDCAVSCTEADPQVSTAPGRPRAHPTGSESVMRLRTTDWKHAWFESHISDRFFQEMSKLERGAVQDLETSAQWMEQIMIEVGTLAQAMIRLEQNDTREPPLRVAYEKSLRLAALALHLITALDGADRGQLRAAGMARTERPGADFTPPRAMPAAPLQPPQAPPMAEPVRPQPQVTAGANPLTPRSSVPWRPPLASARAESRAEPPQSAPDRAETFDDPVPANAPAPNPGMFANLLQVSGRPQVRSESAAHQTIVALDQQGLSRAEIEAVTGEPRHIIEAVLNNARAKAGSGTRTA